MQFINKPPIMDSNNSVLFFISVNILVLSLIPNINNSNPIIGTTSIDNNSANNIKRALEILFK